MEEKIDLLVKYTIVNDLFQGWHQIYRIDKELDGKSDYGSVVKRLGKRRDLLMTQLAKTVGFDLAKEFPI